jgi:hypothetical protein
MTLRKLIHPSLNVRSRSVLEGHRNAVLVSDLKTCFAASMPVRYAPCAVEKSRREQASPAKKSVLLTDSASAARAHARPTFAYAKGSLPQPDSTSGCSRFRMSRPSSAVI